MNIRIEADLTEGRTLLRTLERQVPFAMAVALTRTAEAGLVAVQQEMVSVFDRPTPFTLKAMRVKPAERTDLEAEIFFKDVGGKGFTDAKTRYGHQVFGGQRVAKRMETMLRRSGLLGANEIAVPGRAAKLDAYGNMSRAQIIQILSYFQTFGASGYRANSTQASRDRKARGTRTRRGERFFVKADKPGRGVYRSVQTAFGWAIQPVLMFVRQGSYDRRLDFDGTVIRSAQGQMERQFNEAVRRAVRTAR